MPQQTSPFIEGKYGWSYGESGWNPGMDENLNKFSFMFDANVDGIVGSLPSLVNGQAYFLTTDNRFYFAVGGVYYSSPCPKHFIFKIKSTGDFYQFDGLTTAKIDTPVELNSRLTSVELTISTLGTAAFEDVANLATQAELDIASAQANTYTDTLRADIAAATGAALVGYRSDASGSITSDVKLKLDESLNLVIDFGADPTGTTDNASLIQSAIESATAVNKPLYVPEGVYKIEAYADGSVIRPPTGTRLICHNESWFKLYNTGNYNLTAFFEHSSKQDLIYIDLGIDANFIAGANVFGANNTNNVRLVRPRIKNGRRKPSGTLPGGGRGITFQFNCQNIAVEQPIVIDCTSGIDFHGRQNNGVTEGRLYNIVISSPVIAECEEAISFYDLFDGNADTDLGGDVQVSINDAVVYNCGLATNEMVPGGVATGTEGGVIISERARSWLVHGLSVYNEQSYGKIGGIFRGTGANFYIRDVVAYASVVAPINISPANNLLPVTASTSIQTIAPTITNLDLHGSCDYALFHDSGVGTNNLFQGVFTGIRVPTPAITLTNSIVGLRGGSFMEFSSVSNGARVQGFSDRVNADANAFVSAKVVNAASVSQRHGFDISVLNQLDQLRLERRGTTAGSGRLWANSSGVTIGSDAFTPAFTVDTVNATRDVSIPSSSYTAGRFRLGSYYLWVDASGRLRIHTTAPTADTDGVVVGTQV